MLRLRASLLIHVLNTLPAGPFALEWDNLHTKTFILSTGSNKRADHFPLWISGSWAKLREGEPCARKPTKLRLPMRTCSQHMNRFGSLLFFCRFGGFGPSRTSAPHFPGPFWWILTKQRYERHKQKKLTPPGFRARLMRLKGLTVFQKRSLKDSESTEPMAPCRSSSTSAVNPWYLGMA